jgi:hypothetical protein
MNSIPPHLKEFKWDGRGQTSLDWWQRFKYKFEKVAKITRVEQGASKYKELLNDLFFFNLDVIPRRAPRVQNSRQRKLQAETKEFDKKEFVRIRKNRDKVLFGAVEDQCNDSVGHL